MLLIVKNKNKTIHNSHFKQIDHLCCVENLVTCLLRCNLLAEDLSNLKAKYHAPEYCRIYSVNVGEPAGQIPSKSVHRLQLSRAPLMNNVQIFIVMVS
jgi:hypothetical protein